jgi:molecular chaperone GrpE (heat shock protein)
MSNSIAPKLSKWPFFLGDGLLLATAYFIGYQRNFALGHWELCLVLLCVAGGALLSIAPFVLEYRALVKITEAGALNTAVSQLQNLQGIANQISGATARWQDAQEQADKTAATAREITQRMTGEVQGFTEFMQRANDSERATLRLEVEKLRRAENDWLQVLVRILDHVYALHVGAARSGLPTLIEQVGNFQMACRDAARRVGLTPFTVNEGEPFDAQRHQLAQPGAEPPANALVAETIATGYSFQGRLLRPALVRLRENAPVVAAPTGETKLEKQSRSPLQAASASPKQSRSGDPAKPALSAGQIPSA